jgi:hypothetical protein
LAVAVKFKAGPAPREYDISIGWRPAIEGSDQNWDHGSVLDLLVDATRDSLETAIRADVVAIDAAKKTLAKHKTQVIFRRLLLHLARVFKEKAPILAREQLIDVSAMHSLDLRHEYSLLMRDGFPLLEKAEQAILLSAISDGPKSANWDLSTQEQRTEFEAFARAWKRDRLSMIQTYLADDWKAIYDALVVELGEPSHPEFSSHRSGVWMGPVSPRSAEDLAKMGIDALIEYLSVWRPTRPFMAPSPEGLGRELQKVAAADPSKFLANEATLHRLHPTYVRSVIAGVAETIKGGREVDADKTLDLLAWAVRQERIPFELGGDFTDRDWNWTRRAIVDAVTAMMADRTGLVRSKIELAISYRQRIWEILSVVAEDSDPSNDPEESDTKQIEPSAIALNSVRGASMHAVIQYALWVRRWQRSQDDREARVSAGFSELPEVRSLLEHHLDQQHEKSLAIRSVYGQWFPWLVVLDPVWAAGTAERIFPLAERDALLFDAAWFAYVSFNQVYNDAAKVLTAQYQTAAERLGDNSSKSPIRIRALRSPAAALGEHLVTLYGRGEIPLTNTTLVTFFERADSETREATLAFVGRSLMPMRQEGPKDQSVAEQERRIPSDVLARFQALWDTRVASPSYSEEAPAIGWWFASDLFDDSWALSELVRAAKTGRAIDGLMFGNDRLIRLADTMPLQIAQFLHAFVFQHEKQLWMFELKDVLRPLLTKILDAGGNAATLAVAVVNRLGEANIADHSDLVLKHGTKGQIPKAGD